MTAIHIAYQFRLVSLFFVTRSLSRLFFFFFLNDPAPPEIYPFSLHDALPIWGALAATVCSHHGRRAARSTGRRSAAAAPKRPPSRPARRAAARSRGRAAHSAPAHRRTRRRADRKSTRLNSSH